MGMCINGSPDKTNQGKCGSRRFVGFGGNIQKTGRILERLVGTTETDKERDRETEDRGRCDTRFNYELDEIKTGPTGGEGGSSTTP